MARKLHLWAALAAIAVVVGGCDACGVPQEPVGQLGLPASAVVGQPLTIGLAGTGWRAVTSAKCPTHASVRAGNTLVEEVLVRVEREQSAGRLTCRLAVPASVTLTPVASDVDGDGQIAVTVRYRHDDANVLVTESAYLHGKVRALPAGTPVTGAGPIAPAPGPPAPQPPAPQPPADEVAARFAVDPASPRTGRTARLDASASTAAAGIAAYAWDLDGDGSYETPAEGPVHEHVFPRRETVSVGLRVTARDGKVATAAQGVVVEEPAGPAVSIAIAGRDPATRTVTFQGDAVDPDGDAIGAFTWDFGDGTPPADGPTVTHTFPGAGPYRVRLEVRDATGMVGDAEVDVAPAVRRARGPAGASATAAATATAAQGRKQGRPVALSTPFTLAVEGTSMRLGPLVHAPGRLRAPRLRAAGTAAGTLPAKVRRRAPAGVGVFAAARWAGRFEVRAAGRLATLDPRKVSGTGTVLAVSTRSPRTSVCLRVAGAVGANRGTFTILGGTGAAKRLHGTGGFGRRERLRVRTGAERKLPAACRALRPAVPQR